MPIHSQSHLDAKSSLAWQFSFALVLLCGLVTWSSASTSNVPRLETSLLFDQFEQLPLVESLENLRSKAAYPNDAVTPKNKLRYGSDGSMHLGINEVFAVSGLSTHTAICFSLSNTLPSWSRYSLPASREPPKA